ncbi:unnamed protein product [Boreogadus saida]
MIRPSFDPADALFVGGCVWAYVYCSAVASMPGLEGALRTIRVRMTSQKGPALYLAFLQRGPALYLAFVFADAGHLWVFAIAGLQNLFWFPPPGSPPPTLF